MTEVNYYLLGYFLAAHLADASEEASSFLMHSRALGLLFPKNTKHFYQQILSTHEDRPFDSKR